MLIDNDEKKAIRIARLNEKRKEKKIARVMAL